VDDGIESASRQAAPGALALVQAFVNTLEYEQSGLHREALRTPDELRAWLHGHGLLEDGAPPSERDLRRARDVREALRALLLGNNGEAISADAVATLNRVAADACLVVQFGADGQSQIEPRAGGVDGALGRLLAIVNTAMTDGTWPRLKACRSHTCRWAFYDASKNRSGAWCSMATCGCRSKARTYRARRRREEIDA
jgi:predicted RNA-binding Zn ribbon-like protein